MEKWQIEILTNNEILNTKELFNIIKILILSDDFTDDYKLKSIENSLLKYYQTQNLMIKKQL